MARLSPHPLIAVTAVLVGTVLSAAAQSPVKIAGRMEGWEVETPWDTGSPRKSMHVLCATEPRLRARQRGLITRVRRF